MSLLGLYRLAKVIFPLKAEDSDIIRLCSFTNGVVHECTLVAAVKNLAM